MEDLTIDEILEMMQNKKYALLKQRLSTMNPTDIALALEEVPRERFSGIFRLLPSDLAAEVFVQMDSDTQEALILGFSDKELHEILNEMYVDDTVDVIEEMPSNVVKRILASSDRETREQINQILKYPKDSAGSIMTTEYVTLREKMTVKEAFERIKKTGPDSETIYTCYVTDNNRRLIGVLTAKDLMLADEDEIVGNLMDRNVISAGTHDDREETANMIREYSFIALPVVDGGGRIVGIVTVDDAMDVISEESEEDFSKMAAITPSDESYIKTSVFKLWKSRIPWLLLLMVSATFTSSIISKYEEAMSSLVILTAFIPMIMDTGGNAGGQSSVTLIRALSLGDVQFSDFFKVVFKELRVALLCALPLSVACFIKTMIIDLRPDQWVVGITVSLTLGFTVVFAKLVGCSLPLLAKKLHLDPAVMASPFITTIVDAISLLLYFNVAKLLIPGLS